MVKSQFLDGFITGEPFMREYPPDPFYPNGEGKMLKTPIDSSANSTVKCSDPLPVGTYPLPRCIGNVFEYNFETYDVDQRSKLRSKRRTSHMITWFGHYITFNIVSSLNNIVSDPIYIPADDANYNPPNSIPGELSANGTTSLPFNMSETFDPNPLNTA
ncbi:6599_t:CDS:1, partial [Funneliformis mosseae]